MSDRPRPRRSRRHDPTALEGAVVPPSPSTVDLHTHSIRSDGVLSPVDLMRDVAAAGVRTFSLTDHDTLAGYRDLLAADAVPAGMTLIPGVEINALVTRDIGLWEWELHILGFGMDPDDEAFEATLATQRAARRSRFDRTVTLLREIGLPIDAQVEALATEDDDALGRPTIARALIAAGFATTVEDAFSRIIGHGRPGYVRREGLGPEDAIAAISAAGGIPVLAHFREGPGRPDVIGELMAHGLRGLEVYYRSFDRATVEAMAALAETNGLIASGGSDYHGDLGPYSATHAQLWVPPEVGDALVARFAAR
jgi:3',5'-nucleoside bisphosphate phosphatase